MNDKTEPTSISESKTISELQDEIQALKAENQLLQSVSQMLNPDSERSGEPGQRLTQVYPHIVSMLTNDGFKEAYRLIVDDIQRQVFNTQPNNPEARELLYFQAQGMSSLLTKLAYMAKTVQQSKPD
jgi:hypothetical protein